MSRRRPTALVALAAATLATAAPTSAEDVIGLQLRRSEVEARLSDENLLLLAVELDSFSVTDSLAVYGDIEDPLIPLGELARLLDLDLTVAPRKGEVVGRVGEARRPLAIDIPKRLIRVSGRAPELAVEDLGLTANDVYVPASAVSQLLPVTAEVDPEGMILRIVARETLPIQARLQRAARRQQLLPDGERAEPSMTLATPYRLVSAPAFDVSMDLTSGGGAGFGRRAELRTAGDLLGAGYQFYVGTDERGAPADARLCSNGTRPTAGCWDRSTPPR